MIKYVTRNPDGSIAAVYDYHMPDVNDEQFADSDRAIVAFYAAMPKSQPTPRAWLERLAPATQAAITAAATKDTTGAMLLWRLKAAGNPTIDVTSPETIASVQAMVTAGVITAQEQATLLAP
jgi:hypothetical protein